MEDTGLLQEYVLNDVGKVWVGPIKTTRGKPWFYGQFDAAVLPACMFMLDRAEMPFHQLVKPVFNLTKKNLTLTHLERKDALTSHA